MKDIKLMSKCFTTFEKWIKEVPVIGINSAKYDCNVMKVYLDNLCDALRKCDFVVDQKAIFPYEWLDDYKN